MAFLQSAKMRSHLHLSFKAVESSSIAAVAYDTAHRLLAVRFHHGREYWYHDVTREVYDAMLAAPSVGAYFNDVIRSAGYDYHRQR